LQASNVNEISFARGSRGLLHQTVIYWSQFFACVRRTETDGTLQRRCGLPNMDKKGILPNAHDQREWVTWRV